MMGMTAFADSENAIICHAELVSASRSKTRWTLTRPVLRRPSKIMDPSLDKINTKIPKQVRDDKERDFQKVMTGLTAFADSQSVIICHAEHVSASRSMNRSAPKNEDPLNVWKSRERTHLRRSLRSGEDESENRD